MRKALMIVTLFCFWGCAQQVAPTGGQKDVAPPKILSEFPANLSTSFSAKEVVVSFDEFIQLKNTAEQVVISPPILKAPSYLLKKKSLVIKFDQELAENTTYTINFGEAIRDNNEGNILSNYTYVFSTGLHLDSMEVKGMVRDALTDEPIKDAVVMLYKSNLDSLPLDTIPNYFTRSTETGSFHIKNIGNQPYKIFALKDENTNYKFDVPEEQIGFLDTMVLPFSAPKPVKVDSAQVDSAITKLDPPLITSYEMKMFFEEDTTQFLKKSYCDHFGKLVFVYNRPVSDFTIQLEDVPFKSQWNIKDFSAHRDSITIWTTGIVPDTMRLILNADKARVDTTELVMKPRADNIETKSKSKGGGRKKKKEAFALTARTIPSNGRSPKPNRTISLVWNHPIISTDLSRIKLYKDSVRVNYDIVSTDTALRVFDIIHDWQKNSKYRLLVQDSAFSDIYNLWSDTVDFSFVGTDQKSYGELSLKISDTPESQIVVELLEAGRGSSIEKRLTNQKGIVKFEGLNPGKYSIRVTRDLNNNGRWDSGRYSEKLQPEPIQTIENDAEVRSNWELELEWNPNE
jgi:hypothetical protein